MKKFAENVPRFPFSCYKQIAKVRQGFIKLLNIFGKTHSLDDIILENLRKSSSNFCCLLPFFQISPVRCWSNSIFAFCRLQKLLVHSNMAGEWQTDPEQNPDFLNLLMLLHYAMYYSVYVDRWITFIWKTLPQSIKVELIYGRFAGVNLVSLNFPVVIHCKWHIHAPSDK